MDSDTGTLGREPIAIAVCCFAIIVSLVAGVGLGTGSVLRHVAHTLFLWIAIAFGMRGARPAGWIGRPLFLFWLTLMLFIWLYLLGIARIMSGHFSPIEIAMTIIVAVTSVIGVAIFTRLRSSLFPATAVTTFLAIVAVQRACFRISFLPAIAHR